MTDRYNALTVILKKDIRSDDAEQIIAAINQLKGVLDVKGNVADIDIEIATSRARQTLRDKLWKILYDDKS